MNIHKNARLTPLRREEMALSVIEGRLSKAQAARVYGVSAKIAARWVERYKTEGRAGTAKRKMGRAVRARPNFERLADNTQSTPRRFALPLETNAGT